MNDFHVTLLPNLQSLIVTSVKLKLKGLLGIQYFPN